MARWPDTYWRSVRRRIHRGAVRKYRRYLKTWIVNFFLVRSLQNSHERVNNYGKRLLCSPLFYLLAIILVRRWVSHWSKTVFAVIHCTFNDKEKVLCSDLICSGRSFYPSLSLRFLKEVTSQGAHINCLTVRMWELRRKVLFLVLNCDEYWHVISIHPFQSLV